MITFDHVSVTYPGSTRPVLHDVSLHVPEGEMALVVGHTGVGKTTLLRAVNGLVPHFTGGVMSGHVTVAGRDTREYPPRELADVVGLVMQRPAAGFVADTVEDELAYGMESLGVAPQVMRRRVEESVDLLGLASLRDRALHTLSAGEQQRVAIGAVLTTHPHVLVLDEPTSALDPGAAEDVLAVLHRLVQDLGLTVLLAEHRLERVVQFCDRVVILDDAGGVASGPTAQMVAVAPVAPPIVQLARTQGWDPPPVSVREARRMATVLRRELAGYEPPHQEASSGARSTIDVAGLCVRRGASFAVDDASLSVDAGEVVAVMGRNGAGKTTLLRTLVGLTTATTGHARVEGRDVRTCSPKELLRLVGFVPADPADLLWAEAVAEECLAADHDADLPAGTTAQLLTRFTTIDPTRHPRDLSEGQRLALALAIVLAPAPRVLLLDEPTRGLDYAVKDQLVRMLRAHCEAGGTVMVATHDVELAAEVATRVVVLADGQVVTDGPVREVLTASPQFAPQVTKVLSPTTLLTVDDVATALAVHAR